MATTQTEFEVLQTELAAGGVPAVLERLVEQLRAKSRYHELFEALKMKVRLEIGLPVQYDESGDELDEATRLKLEEGLVDACREVGMLMIRDGAIREAWMYLRPVGDRAAAAAALAEVESTDENLDEMVEVCLHEGVDPARGFRLVLDHYGTCNAITTFEATLQQRTPAEQRHTAGMLVEHLHGELLASVKADIAQNEGAEPEAQTLRELVSDRDWLFGEHRYHLDTTHLASTVRFARLLEDGQQLRLALDMTEYGRRLSDQFQYEGDEPFTDIYPSHALFYQAVLGENLEEALEFFRQKAETVDAYEYGRSAIEIYIDLLARLGRLDEAIEATIQYSSPDAQPIGHAPSLLELSDQAGNYDRLLDHCRDHDDLLGFATGLVRGQREA